jgi:hypothetical protein
MVRSPRETQEVIAERQRHVMSRPDFRAEWSADLFLSGPLGEDQHIGAGIVRGIIHASVFFRDTLQPLVSGLHPPIRPAFLRSPDTSAAFVVG